MNISHRNWVSENQTSPARYALRRWGVMGRSGEVRLTEKFYIHTVGETR
jgi:hypothetical protein